MKSMESLDTLPKEILCLLLPSPLPAQGELSSCSSGSGGALILFFFSLRMLQALGSTEASAEFIVVALEKGKKEIGLFLLPCCGFFSSPAVSLSAAVVHRLQGGPGTFQPFQQGWCFQSAFSEHPQLQPHRAGSWQSCAEPAWVWNRRDWSPGLHVRVSPRALGWGTQVSLGFSPFYILVLLVYLLIFVLVEILPLIFILVEVPPLIFYLGNAICFNLRRELRAQSLRGR